MVKPVVINWWREHRWFIWALLVVAIVNHQPWNSVVALGDFYQLLEPERNITSYFFTWWRNSGQGLFNPVVTSWPFYLWQAILGLLELPPSVIGMFWLWFFFSGTYLSFYWSLSHLRSHFSTWTSWKTSLPKFASLFYALNIYTFALFQYSWGYTHHLLTYLVLPPLMVLFYDYLAEPSRFKLWRYSAVFFVATFTFNNPAWLALVWFGQGLILFAWLLVLTWRRQPFAQRLNLIGRATLTWLITLFLSLYFLIPFFVAQSDQTARFFTDAQTFVKNDPLPLWELMRLKNLTGFFPNYSLYTGWFINFIVRVIYYLPWVFVLIFVGSMIYRAKKKRRPVNQALLVWLIVWLVLAVLAVRIGPPFASLNTFIYRLPGMSLFRAAEKMQALYTFFFTCLLALTALGLRRHWQRWLVVGVMLAIPFPLYIGGINKYVSARHDSEYWTVLKDNGIGTAIKVPQEYLDIVPIINNKRTETSVVSLPYSVINSGNWSVYPAWNMLGHDFLYALYNRPYISANTHTDPGRKPVYPFAELAKEGATTEQLLNTLEAYGSQFIIWHKDIDKLWLDRSQHLYLLLQKLVVSGQLKVRYDSSLFTLYEQPLEQLVPIISAETTAQFQRLNFTQYRVVLSGIKETTKVTFRQTYSRFWRLYASVLPRRPDQRWCKGVFGYPSTKTVECIPLTRWLRPGDLTFLWRRELAADQHNVASQYASEWVITPATIDELPTDSKRVNSDGTYDIALVINYIPQTYYYWGLLIAAATLLIVRRIGYSK